MNGCLQLRFHASNIWRCFLSNIQAGGSGKLKKLELAEGQSGMVLPLTPAGVSFKSIYYKVPMPVGADGEINAVHTVAPTLRRPT